ncbi:dihydropyrimidinase [Alicyclobacillus mali (ex Roth et al. 2021)]|uniref:dihydropyrimidinase n=1 Tax=Alicyclobacillus mali (ex Roth et al. 2021) TaxID=1123961 RepID=UPI001A8CA5D9
MTAVWVRGGMIVTASDVFAGDVWIEDGVIRQVGVVRPSGEAHIIDAPGMYVMPGAIDEHTHMGMPFNGTVSADWDTETIAAAIGGTTTIVDFAIQRRGGTLVEAIETWRNKADGRTAIDYGLHVAITDPRPEVIAEIPEAVKRGVTTVKVFMAYKGEMMVDDTALFQTLLAAREVGALVMIHAENGDAVVLLQDRLYEANKRAPRYHAESRPLEVEAEATRRAIALAKLADAPLFIVHVTGREPMEEIRRARHRGQRVYGETCPQYLLLDESYLALPGFEGAKYVCSPPLRHASHQGALWTALAEGVLQTIGTDHCSFNFREQKHMGRDDFRKIPNGLNGIENWVQLIYTYGVCQGRISLSRMVDLISTQPAKLMGLYPRKGTLAVGADADLLIYDPSGSTTITAQTQHQNSDYNAYEGFVVQGKPQWVLLRGNVIVQEGKHVGTLQDGRFVPCSPYSAAYGEKAPFDSRQLQAELVDA